MANMTYYADRTRHLVCDPYSIENLHRMADDLGIKRCWFHRDHYDIPKKQLQEILDKCVVISPRYVHAIIHGRLVTKS